jgi:CTP:molybdopterin cytidylyltransferase MocA
VKPAIDVAAIILAAGAGRRLGGVAKAALVRRDGRTFLAAVLDAARAAGARPIVVVAEPHGAAVAALAGDAPVVWNLAPERGMIGSLACGIAAAGAADVALAWPVDHADVAAATVRAVLAAADRDRIVVPVHAGRGGHPTAFGAAVFAELAAAATARAVVAADPRRVVRLPVDDPGVVRDVDLPEDLP